MTKRNENKIYDSQLKRLVANFLNANMIALSNGHLTPIKPSEIIIIDKDIDKMTNMEWDILHSVTFIQAHSTSGLKKLHYTNSTFKLEYLQ